MRCPYCGNVDTQVKDSRPSEDNSSIRRRRVCQDCGGRFTTFERVQLRELMVLKRSGRRVPFDRDASLLEADPCTQPPDVPMTLREEVDLVDDASRQEREVGVLQLNDDDTRDDFYHPNNHHKDRCFYSDNPWNDRRQILRPVYY